MNILASLTGAIVLLAGSSLQATLLLSDDFTGTAGSLLNARPVQYYDSAYYSTPPIWAASPRLLISGSNSIRIDVPNNSAGASAPIAPALSAGSLSIESTITTAGATYVALALLANGNTNVFDAANPFLLSIWDNGGLTLYKNGGTKIYEAGISGFSSSTAYSIRLQYSFETGLASIYINNSLFNSLTVTGLTSSSITGAGFYMLNAQTGTTVDNFSVNAVPEPNAGSLAALAIVVGMGFFHSRRILGRAKGRDTQSHS